MKKIIVVITVLFSFHLNAQIPDYKVLKSVEEIKALSKETSRLFSEKKHAEAIGKIREYWPIADNEVNTLLEGTVKYSNILDERFGAIIGYEKVKDETIKDFAIRETYLVKYEFNAIRLIFVYYKTSKGWIVNSFKWDDNFIEEFK